VNVYSGTMAMGQGLETSYTQLVGEVLGVSFEKSSTPPTIINKVKAPTAGRKNFFIPRES